MSVELIAAPSDTRHQLTGHTYIQPPKILNLRPSGSHKEYHLLLSCSLTGIGRPCGDINHLANSVSKLTSLKVQNIIMKLLQIRARSTNLTQIQGDHDGWREDRGLRPDGSVLKCAASSIRIARERTNIWLYLTALSTLSTATIFPYQCHTR